jgi:hypothetical protein
LFSEALQIHQFVFDIDEKTKRSFNYYFDFKLEEIIFKTGVFIDPLTGLFKLFLTFKLKTYFITAFQQFCFTKCEECFDLVEIKFCLFYELNKKNV